MPSAPQRNPIIQARDQVRDTIKRRAIAVLPGLIEEWEDAVRTSGNPKDFKDYVVPLMEMLEIKPKDNSSTNLPTLHINILRPDGSPVSVVGQSTDSTQSVTIAEAPAEPVDVAPDATQPVELAEAGSLFDDMPI